MIYLFSIAYCLGNVGGVYAQGFINEVGCKIPNFAKIRVGNKSFEAKDEGKTITIEYPSENIPIEIIFEDVIIEAGYKANVIINTINDNAPRTLKNGNNRLVFTHQVENQSAFMVIPTLTIFKDGKRVWGDDFIELNCTPKLGNSKPSSEEMVAKTAAPTNMQIAAKPKIGLSTFDFNDNGSRKHFEYALFVNQAPVSGSNPPKEIACKMNQQVPIELKLANVDMTNMNASVQLSINGSKLAINNINGTTQELKPFYLFKQEEYVNITATISFTDSYNNQHLERLTIPHKIRLYDPSIKKEVKDTFPLVEAKETKVENIKDEKGEDINVKESVSPPSTEANNEENHPEEEEGDNFPLLGLSALVLLGGGIGVYHLYQKKQEKGKVRRGKPKGHY